MFVKGIKVSDTSWEELKLLKEEYNLDNVDQVIQQLIELYNQCKKDGALDVS
jgi:predicted DNA-binding protein (UPF0278 family)